MKILPLPLKIEIYGVNGIIIDNIVTYEGWNFNSGNYLFTTDAK